MNTTSTLSGGTDPPLSVPQRGPEQALPSPKPSSEDKTTDTAAETTSSNEKPPRESSMTQNIWLFIFRGQPHDTYHRRHVLLYLDSPDVVNFHFTAHAQRPGEGLPFEYVEMDGAEEYPMMVQFLSGKLLGKVKVDRSQSRRLVDVIAATPVGGEPEWSCQHFVYEALERLTECGAIASEDLNAIEDWMMDCLLDGAVE